MRRLLAVVALIAACKDKPQAPTSAPPPSPRTGDAALAAPTARPKLPTDPTTAAQPLAVEEAQRVLPAIEGAVILALKQTSDHKQVHGTWCVEGESADAVAKSVGHLMAQAGYGELSIRGDAKKAGVSGDRNGLRLSMIVSASSATICKAPEHYFASATIFRP